MSHMFRMSSVAHGWDLGQLKSRVSVASSVITSLKLLVMASASPSSSSRGPNVPHILTSNKLEMFGSLSLSKLNLSLVFLAFFDPLSRTRKVIMTKSWSLPMSAPGNVLVFALLTPDL